MNKADKIMPWIIVGTTILVATASYFAQKALMKSAEAQEEYYKKTEALLDSINKWDNSFRDTVMESDAYYEYEVAREQLKKDTTK